MDFLIAEKDTPALMIEVKWSDANLSPNFAVFDQFFSFIRKIQLIMDRLDACMISIYGVRGLCVCPGGSALTLVFYDK